MSDFDWFEDANCKGKWKDVDFYPHAGNYAQKVAEAKSLCAECIVRPQCLEYALVHQEDNGVWGGKTEGERRNIRLTKKRYT